MRIKSGSVLAIAFAGLLLLILVALLASRRKMQQVYTQLDEVNLLHRHVETKLRRVRSEINLSGIFIRDYLLDNTTATGMYYRQQLAGLRKSTLEALAELDRITTPTGQLQERLTRLRGNLEGYWEAFDPVLDWTPEQKSALSFGFLRREVIPRREAALLIAREIESLNDANMTQQRTDVARREQGLHTYLNQMLGVSMLLGLVLATGAVYRISVLEHRSEEQRRRAEAAEKEMRALSNQLVKVHEEERRNLSRELHDEVGQMLTGLRMEFGKAEKTQTGSGPVFQSHMQECKDLIDRTIETVRDLSMGLRPSMLDDFGLGAALEWQARDFLRRYKVPVHVSLDGAVDEIGEPHRTSVYRIVQEALTNCARHAKATHISISLRRQDQVLAALIQDDGIGFSGTEPKFNGLGLLGMKERVRDLDGSLSFHSAEGAGTTIKISIPLPSVALVGHDASSNS